MTDFEFDPESLSVAAGDSVLVKNSDPFVHTFTVEELDIDVSLVRRLLSAQFPQWADLPLERVPSAGTDNPLYRLGEDMVVRMPRIHWAIGQVEKEHRWLPRLATGKKLSREYVVSSSM
jgi:hypothetical protein